MFFRRFRLSAGHLKETENYVRLALHFKGERQRARLLEHRRGAMSGRLLCPEMVVFTTLQNDAAPRNPYFVPATAFAGTKLQGILMEV